MNDFFVRQSSVKEFAVCPLRWYYKDEETPFVSRLSKSSEDPLWACIGNGFHKFMEIGMATGDWDVDKFMANYNYDNKLFDGAYDLLRAVCKHYVVLSRDYDKTYFSNSNLIPLEINGSRSEIHFEIPMGQHKDNNIIFSGTIDAVVESKRDGRLWVVDHKTVSGNFKTALDIRASYAAHEVQSGFYLYALKRLGYDAAGIIYNLVLKVVPETPPMLKTGKISKKRSLETCEIYFREWMDYHGYEDSDWWEQLEAMKGNERKIFRRVAFERNAHYISSMEQVILDWGRRMIDEREKDVLHVLHNGGTHCLQCSYRERCLNKIMKKSY